jgi:catechol 2,3-dioxygenase-like lactoylglutathione lyase family enzyme
VTLGEAIPALPARDVAESVAFYRDRLGLPVIESFEGPGGGGVVLAAGRATLELLSTAQTDLVDQIETADPQPGPGGPGRAGAGPPVRLAIEVDDSAAAAEALVASGAERLGGPVVTPWQHRNVRLQAPDGLQLTLFTVLDPDDPYEGPSDPVS